MKKIYSLVALVAMSFGASAQVNMNFEAPITEIVPGIVSTTAGWGEGPYVATEGNGGGQGVLLKNRAIEDGVQDGYIIQAIDLDDLEDYIANLRLNMDFKFLPQGGDTMFIGWSAWNVDGANEVMVYNGNRIFTQDATVWSSFSGGGFDLVREAGVTQMANQLYIMISSSRIATTVDTELYLDNVRITGFPTSAIDKVTKNGFNIFPNPATDVVNVSVEEGQVASVDVLTLDGKVVVSTTNSKVDVSELTSGMYLFTVRSTYGATTTQKVTVK